MKITLPESAVKTLKDILQDNQDRPQTIRVYFAGIGWGGPSFGIALDEQKDSDVAYEVEGLQFIMDKNEYVQHGDIVIEDTGYGFFSNSWKYEKWSRWMRRRMLWLWTLK